MKGGSSRCRSYGARVELWARVYKPVASNGALEGSNMRRVEC